MSRPATEDRRNRLAEDLDELVQQIRPDGTVIRTVTKRRAHEFGLLHRVVLGEVRDQSGNVVLVRQASDRQDAGQLVSPVGGHVRANETVEQAIEREAFEEIGIIGCAFRKIGTFIYDRRVLHRIENHHFTVFLITADPKRFDLGPEAIGIEVLARDELPSRLEASPSSFGGAFHALLSAGFTELGFAAHR